jgi:hypothetical protein
MRENGGVTHNKMKTGDFLELETLFQRGVTVTSLTSFQLAVQLGVKIYSGITQL